MAKLVSDPWFCAAVTSQVGLGAHFFSFTSFLRDSQCWECSHPVRRSGLGAEGRAGGAKAGAEGVFKSAEGLTLPRRGIFLPFSGVRSQQTATFGSYACYFSGFINNLMALVGIDCCS